MCRQQIFDRIIFSPHNAIRRLEAMLLAHRKWLGPSQLSFCHAAASLAFQGNTVVKPIIPETLADVQSKNVTGYGAELASDHPVSLFYASETCKNPPKGIAFEPQLCPLSSSEGDLHGARERCPTRLFTSLHSLSRTNTTLVAGCLPLIIEKNPSYELRP